MESDEACRKPIIMRAYAGVTVTFNPRWVIEIKIGERPMTALRSGKLLRCRQRVIVIHTLINAYHIPARWWVDRYDPTSFSILFSIAATWFIDTERAEHVITCPKQYKHVVFEEEEEEEEENGKIKFSYLDIERVDHRDGTVLWQKKR